MNHFSRESSAGINRSRLYETIACRINQLIVDENMGPGDRLPSERELAATLGVSRSSLREGLIALELQGTIEVRSNAGIFVVPNRRAAGSMTTEGVQPHMREVLQACLIVEIEVAAVAARCATVSGLHMLRLAFSGLEASGEAGTDLAASLRHFHLTLAESSGNAALAGIVRELWRLHGNALYRLDEPAYATAFWKAVVLDYRRLVAAIHAKNVLTVRKAMGWCFQQIILAAAQARMATRRNTGNGKLKADAPGSAVGP